MTQYELTKGAKRKTTTDEVVDYIRVRIRDGRYKTGDKLPSEDELAKEIGVGRSSIREGMKILKVYGVVEIRQGGGTFVSDKTGEHMFDFLWYMSGSTHENFIDFRKAVEVGGVTLIYQRLTEADYQKLQELIDLLDPRNDLDVIIQADREFHRIISNYDDNPLQRQIENMMYQIRIDTLYKTLCNQEDVESTKKMHQDILDALKEKKLEKILKAVTDHIETARENIISR